MFKTFLIGVMLGAAAAVATLYFVPAVDQSREDSMIIVRPVLGNAELFHVKVPMDRIMIGTQGQSNELPEGLEWPDDIQFAGIRAEMFLFRNSRDAVIGVASRLSVATDDGGNVIEWVLHLPARGSAYFDLSPDPREGGYRVGNLRGGTREFSALEGQITERWVADPAGFGEAPSGRIELTASLARHSGELQ